MSAAHEAVSQTESRHAHAEWIGGQIAKFKGMEVVPLPVLTDLARQMDILRVTGRQQDPGAPRDGMCVKRPSGVGKSTSARMLVRSAAKRADVPESESPVLLVELEVEGTESLWNAILRALGDPYWDVGYPKALKKRATKFLAKRGIELIIIDEFNHCVDRGQAKELMNTVKLILNAGIAPIVCMGTDDELDNLPSVPAFERRMLSAPIIGPLEWQNPDHQTNWRGFLQGLDHGIVNLGILPSLSGLGSKKLAEALCVACGGVIGYAHWVVQDALTEVLKRADQSIERVDLAISVNRLFVKHSIYDRENSLESFA